MSSFINFKNSDYTKHPEVHTSDSSMVMNSKLTQQSSIRFDELQHKLSESAKDFGSMHMDEFLKNIWANSGVYNNLNLQKQESLNLPRTLSKKTVDEVWKELVTENIGFKDVKLIKESNFHTQEKQSDLGEMTLEEFLRKAGVVSEYGQKHPNQNNGFHQQAVVTHSKTEINNVQDVRSSQHPKLLNILPKQAGFNFASNGVSIYGKVDNRINLVNESQLGSDVNGLSTNRKCDHPTKSKLDASPSPPVYAYGDGGICGRNMSGSLEKAVERRRKRMIKNRESASRSRARKQAYTLELEAEVAKLKQLNHELRKTQEETMESRNFQAPKKMNSRGEKKLCLRRTLTAPW